MNDRSPVSETPAALLSADVVTALGRLGRVEALAAGATVFERASSGDAMYLVEQGEVELDFGGAEKSNKRLGVGAFFGELALLTGNHQRTATVRACQPTRLRVIDQAAFNAFLRQDPESAVDLLRSTCLYLLQAERSLIDELRRRNSELAHTLDFLRRTEQELNASEILALTDELTGLYNRRCLLDRAKAALQDARRGPRRISLLLADLDHFKVINDSFGHQVGDEVLIRFARALEGVLRRTDLPCRHGGDEFAALLVDVTEEDAVATAERLLRHIRTLTLPGRTETSGRTGSFTCTIGGAMLQPNDSWESLFERADRSLYQAKQAGRDCICYGERIYRLPREP